ncbi:MAG: diadenosine tetraphosphate hydrolase [Euryarchaeota archaeon]|nr:diadenosine tetraphosphate hydrolase [Euryarchaeota archaeon]|tara:strand:- start:799 stop:1236 length:438 start_codon:yes stop_codon:yes gene_type:complete
MNADSPGPMETSCGFILLNYDSILLLQYPQGHWSFPKGHVEQGDTNHHETASRELKEETGIKSVEIDTTWESRTEYTFRKKGRKTTKQVYWYIASTDEVEVELSEEHNSYLWLNYADAESMLTFDQEKELLRSAVNHMEKSGLFP